MEKERPFWFMHFKNCFYLWNPLLMSLIDVHGQWTSICKKTQQNHVFIANCHCTCLISQSQSHSPFDSFLFSIHYILTCVNGNGSRWNRRIKIDDELKKNTFVQSNNRNTDPSIWEKPKHDFAVFLLTTCKKSSILRESHRVSFSELATVFPSSCVVLVVRLLPSVVRPIRSAKE